MLNRDQKVKYLKQYQAGSISFDELKELLSGSLKVIMWSEISRGVFTNDQGDLYNPANDKPNTLNIRVHRFRTDGIDQDAFKEPYTNEKDLAEDIELELAEDRARAFKESKYKVYEN